MLLIQKGNQMRHKHADLMMAYAKNRDLKFEYFSSISNGWNGTDIPSFHEDLEYRIKPTIQRYRVAFMKDEDGEYWTTTQDENTHFNPEMESQFVRWRTDWIEYEVPSTTVD